MKRLLLLGGGHSHVEVLRRFGVRNVDSAEVTVVSPARLTPYTGMLPGLLAGHYQDRDCRIDVEALARRAGARFVRGYAQRVDAAGRRVVLTDGSALAYDVVSIDVGSVPVSAGIPGVVENALGVKPFEAFLPAWDRLVRRAESGGIRRIAVVGGGAGGVEVVLAAQYRLRGLSRKAVQFALVTDASRLVPTHNAAVGSALHRILSRRGIDLHFQQRIACVTPDAVIAANGERIPADTVIWATGAAPPPLLHAMPVALDVAGFIATAPSLQSISHPELFAAGDCASIRGLHYPKSGVYAVRQGPVLAANLRRALRRQPLAAFRPQRRALALISAGERYAVAAYGPLKLEGAWVWRWKDHIVRSFIARYRYRPGTPGD